MTCLFYVLFIIYCVLFVKSSAAIPINSSIPRTRHIYYLDSGLPSAWYTNSSVVMNRWNMKVILSVKGFYCGFYCSRSCNFYLFSVVAVGGGSHNAVWSANTDHPLRGNASVQLMRDKGLVLRDSEGNTVWSACNNASKSVVGMNLTEAGNLVIFDNQSAMLWQSFDHPVGASLIGQKGQTLVPSLPSEQRKYLGLPTKLRAIASSIAALTIILVGIFFCYAAFLQLVRLKEDQEDIKQVPGLPLSFSYEDLEIATEKFKEKLGSGGFGSVFKGVLADGTMIAVKRLDKMSQEMREFLAEVETIGRLHHFNLVRLVGFCAENSCRLLVYEYMTNGSLDNWIFNRSQAHRLSWQTRKKIILDVAKGLAYFHEECRQKIIHLDIKPHNILLDENFNAKVSDFGLSKLIERDESQVLIPMRGTPGYLAPELQRSIVTVKVDVYSFGIVILEIVSKRRNVDSSLSESSFHLLDILQKKAQENKLIEIVEDLDEDMQNDREEVVRMISIGAWCLQNDHTKRPSMSTVVKVLEGVMEVESNISYTFSHARAYDFVANDHITVAPQASILSAPR